MSDTSHRPLNGAPILFITLDSCRYDTFVAAKAPRLKALGALHEAEAPGYFTYASHAAMFMGFTPGVAAARVPHINPKFAKMFRLKSPNVKANDADLLTLEGANIIDGLKRLGYLCLGTAAMRWFDPSMPSGRTLTHDFDRFFYCGPPGWLNRQIEWLERELTSATQPVFAFLNVGETHAPYYHEGAAWDPYYNPCVPFGRNNDASECRRRQVACLEWIDDAIGRLLDKFAGALVIVCGDHGDCWGEDDLWEHGFYHPKIVAVPLIVRLPPGLETARA